MEIVDGILWGIVFGLCLIAVALTGQAAYIRSRMDLLAPASTPEDLLACSACYPAVRAYSVRINVSATNKLQSDATTALVPVQAMRQLGSCPGNETILIDRGRYTAKWLVLRGVTVGQGGAQLVVAASA